MLGPALLVIGLCLVALSQGATIALDGIIAGQQCSDPSAYCSFFNATLWEGGVAPTAGDSVDLLVPSGYGYAYIALNAPLALDGVQIIGNLTLWVNNAAVRFGTFNLVDEAQLWIHNAAFSVGNATVSDLSMMTIDGNSNFTVGTFSCEGYSLILMDQATIVADSINLGGINTTIGTSVTSKLMVINSGDSCTFEGYANVQHLFVQAEGATFFNGSLGNTYVFASMTAVGPVSFQTITIGGQECTLFLGEVNMILSGPPHFITGAGEIVIMDSSVAIGNSSFITDLRYIQLTFYGNNNVTLNSLLLNFIETDAIPSPTPLPQVNNFVVTNVTFSETTNMTGNFQMSGEITLEGAILYLVGNVTSTADLTIIPASGLICTQFIQNSGSISLDGEIGANLITISSSTLNATNIPSTLSGNVELINTEAFTNFNVEGNLLLNTVNISIAGFQEIQVGGTVTSSTQSTNSINGTIQANTFLHTSGQLDLQSGSIAATLISINQLPTSTQDLNILNPITLNGDVAIKNIDVNLFADLIVQGSLSLENYTISSRTGTDLLQVSGLLASVGHGMTAYAITINAGYYSHNGGITYTPPGTLVALQITLSNTLIELSDVAISNGFSLNGNVSISWSQLNVDAPTSIGGDLYLHNVTLFSYSIGNLQVTKTIWSDVSLQIPNNVILSAHSFTQTGGTVTLQGSILSSVLISGQQTFLTVSDRSIINGSLYLSSGNAKLQSSLNITGNLTVDSASQLMVYNTISTNYPTIQVNGDVTISGSLVYFISEVPKKQQVFKFITYTGNIIGTFGSQASYGPQSNIVNFEIQYGNKEILLVFHPTQPVSPGLVVGIVIPVTLAIAASIFGGLYYRQYRRRQSYTAL